MFSLKDFLSVYDQITEDVAALQQQSQGYQNQITQLNQKLQRLLQLKSGVDQQIQKQSQTQNTQAQSTQNQMSQPNASATPAVNSVAPGAAPGMG